MNKLMQWWKTLKPIYKIGLFVGLAIVIGLSLISNAKPETHDVLYSGLSANDSKAIVKELVNLGIDYQLQEEGNTILVDGIDIPKLKLQLASLGLPRYNTTGLESLNETSFTDTKQDKDNKKLQAIKTQIENDLEEGLDIVKDASVGLNIVEGSAVFTKNEKKSDATVKLTLYDNEPLSEEQIRGIQSYVAAYIPNLKPEEVKIIDSKSRLISDGLSSNGSIAGNISKQQQIIHETENRIKSDIMNSLSKVFGYDHVTINVRASINFDEIIQNIEKYDPQGTLISRQRNTEEAEKTEGTLTTEPGTESNGEVPDYEMITDGDDLSLLQNKEEIIENFEVGKTVETIKKNPELTNLNIVVWIDKDMSTDDERKLRQAIGVSAGLQDKNTDGTYENGEVEVVPIFFNQNVEEQSGEKAPQPETGWLGANSLWIWMGAIVVFMLVMIIIGFFLFGKRKETIIIQEEKPEPVKTAVKEEEDQNQKILQGISAAKLKQSEQMDAEDTESKQKQNGVSIQAREAAEKDPRKTSEYIRKLISEG